MAFAIESKVIESLIDLLRRYLGVEVASLNAIRQAVIKCPVTSPITLVASSTLTWNCLTNDAGTAKSASFSAGPLAMSDIAAAINAAEDPETPASVDSQGRLVLASINGAIVGLVSAVCIYNPNGTGTEILTKLGLDIGGHRQVCTPLQAPTWKGVMDGYPMSLDPSALRPGGMIVVLGTVDSKPVRPEVKADLYEVTINLSIWRSEPASQLHRNREPMRACLEAVRRVFGTDTGRYLERPDLGVIRVRELKSRIEPAPLRSKDVDAPHDLLDLAEITLAFTVFERPAATPST